MGLTQVSTDGVKNDAITKTKIPANQIEASELADNAVDTNAIADQAVALSKLPHGDGSSDGKFLRANNGADPSFETVSTDLVADTSPQLGADLDVNDFDIKNGTTIYEIESNTRHNFKAGGNTILNINGNGVDFQHGNNTHADNVQSRFGSGDDLKIYHDGSHSRIDEVGTGNLKIQSNSGVDIQKGSSEDIAKFIADGAVELYHNNGKKFETLNDGVNITGTLKVNGSAFASSGRFLSTQQFTSSGTWTKPSGCNLIRVYVTGGGGGAGGGGAGSGDFGGAGGAGGTAIDFIDVSSVSSVTVTVGAGGTGGSGSSNGSNGSTSSFGSYCSATGGYGGIHGNHGPNQGGEGGVGASATINITGGDGGAGQDNPAISTQYATAFGVGGASYWGGGGCGSSFTAAPHEGKAYGSGGGAAHSSRFSNGAAGKVGFVYVEQYS